MLEGRNFIITYLLKYLFICLREREKRERAHEQRGRKADSLLSAKPDAWHDSRTLRS